MKNKIKTTLLNYDWKESPEEVIKDLEPVLKKLGVYLLYDPLSIGSDTYGYVLTSNPDLTIAEYRKLLKDEYGDADDVLDDMVKSYEVSETDKLSKLIKKI